MKKAAFLGLFLLAMSLIGTAYAILPVVSLFVSANYSQTVNGRGSISQLLQGQALCQNDWGSQGKPKGHHDPPPVGGTR